MRKRLVALAIIAVAFTALLAILPTLGTHHNADQTYYSTVTAIVLTNSFVSDFLQLCDEICSATGYRASCGATQDCGKVWTATPTPTFTGVPTLLPHILTATSLRQTNAAVNTVIAACATLYTFRHNDDFCPSYWLNNLTATP